MRYVLAAALLVALLGSGCRTVYLSPLGLDSNPGTQAQPKRSFQAACVVPGDSEGRFVIVGEGDYPEQGIPPACTKTLFVGQNRPTVRATSASSVSPTLEVAGSEIEIRGINVDSDGWKRKAVHINGNKVRLAHMDIGDINDDKAIEIWGDDVYVQDSNIHEARIVSSDTHTECVFVVGANRLHLLRNTFTGCGVYDVALTRCEWCSPVGAAGTDGVIEGNRFNFSLQHGGTFHYTELAFYSFMQEVRGYTVRNNEFQTRPDDPDTPGNEERGGVLLEPPWVDGTRCGNTEYPDNDANVLGAEWTAPC